MKHITLDAYGGNPRQLDDIKLINETLITLAYKLKLAPICPPQIIPYYYGKVKKDIGVSSFVLLEGGHITIHTFPLRECYFLDIFTTKSFDEDQVVPFLQTRLSFELKSSVFISTDRSKPSFEMAPYSPKDDFGPHLMGEVKSSTVVDMEHMADFLENIVFDINMDPITRAFVLKSTMKNPKFLSGIIVIAQSHIALHYEYKTKKIYADVFSCRPFDYTVVRSHIEKLGEVKSLSLVARGAMHIDKIKANIAHDEHLASMKWQKIIRR
ncbi:MAG: S-adenosylmethionine decarboxylase [Bacilli bacterium]|jgi:S-adenosylmethionine/arginine decarboxylase-like enzyme|nr:S-adenosylmethionine decarboxylase [Bacilli bacterium]MCH4201913.1 S-adenosylmethionine decarboxylase [Bacilli bacterium]MCH4236022.1 S-adenosylmethionine decarboxylase [Bacilli bacterium]